MTVPVVGFQEQDIIFAQNTDKSKFQEVYPEISYQQISGTEDTVTGDLTKRTWESAITVNALVIQSEIRKLLNRHGLHTDNYDAAILFSRPLCEELSIDPGYGDLVIYDGDTWEVTLVKKVDPIGNTTTFLHKLCVLVRYRELSTLDRPEHVDVLDTDTLGDKEEHFEI